MVGPIRNSNPIFSGTPKPDENKNRLNLPTADDLPTHLPKKDKIGLEARNGIIVSFQKLTLENHPHLSAMQLLLDQKSASAKVKLIKELLALLE